jgi:serralysin
LVSPNFEVPTDSDINNTYVVVVRVSDGTNNVDQTITITVTNVNEVPTITSSRSLLAAENGTVVGVLIATDPDAATTLTWSISGGADRTKFTINPATGRLSLTGFQDFENPIRTCIQQEPHHQ